VELQDNAKRLEQEKVSQPLIPLHLFLSSSDQFSLPYYLLIIIPFSSKRELAEGDQLREEQSQKQVTDHPYLPSLYVAC
jgi:hypothetical protein